MRVGTQRSRATARNPGARLEHGRALRHRPRPRSRSPPAAPAPRPASLRSRATCAVTSRSARSSSCPPPRRHEAQAATRRVQTRERIGDRVATEKRRALPAPVAAARPAAAAASSPNATQPASRLAAPVARDAHPAETGNGRDQRLGVESELGERSGSRALDDDVGTLDEGAQLARAPPRRRSRARRSACPRSADRRTPARPRRAPSGRARLSTFTTRAPARAQQLCAERPRPQRREIDDERRCRRPRASRRSPRAATRSHGGGDAAGAPASATGRPSRRARSTSSAADRFATRSATNAHGSSPGPASANHAGSSATSSGRARLTAIQPSRLGSSRQLPPGEIDTSTRQTEDRRPLAEQFGPFQLRSPARPGECAQGGERATSARGQRAGREPRRSFGASRQRHRARASPIESRVRTDSGRAIAQHRCRTRPAAPRRNRQRRPSPRGERSRRDRPHDSSAVVRGFGPLPATRRASAQEL